MKCRVTPAHATSRLHRNLHQYYSDEELEKAGVDVLNNVLAAIGTKDSLNIKYGRFERLIGDIWVSTNFKDGRFVYSSPNGQGKVEVFFDIFDEGGSLKPLE